MSFVPFMLFMFPAFRKARLQSGSRRIHHHTTCVPRADVRSSTSRRPPMRHDTPTLSHMPAPRSIAYVLSFAVVAGCSGTGPAPSPAPQAPAPGRAAGGDIALEAPRGRPTAADTMYDVVIRNGRVLDG